MKLSKEAVVANTTYTCLIMLIFGVGLFISFDVALQLETIMSKNVHGLQAIDSFNKTNVKEA